MAAQRLVIALALCTLASAQRVLIRGARVFDGRQMSPPTSVLVENGRITSVGDTVHTSTASVVDGSGKTLLPGLIDSHVHVWSEDGLRQAAVFGVTTVL